MFASNTIKEEYSSKLHKLTEGLTMKKYLAVLMTILLICSVVGCSSQSKYSMENADVSSGSGDYGEAAPESAPSSAPSFFALVCP